MKKVILIISMLLLCACGNKEVEEKKDIASVKKITCADVNDLVSEGAVVIDVRTPEEYDTDHIENAINIDSSQIKYAIKGKVTDFETKVIVYCQSGRRSAESAKILTELGYKNVYDMGGIIGCYGEE